MLIIGNLSQVEVLALNISGLDTIEKHELLVPRDNHSLSIDVGASRIRILVDARVEVVPTVGTQYLHLHCVRLPTVDMYQLLDLLIVQAVSWEAPPHSRNYSSSRLISPIRDLARLHLWR